MIAFLAAVAVASANPITPVHTSVSWAEQQIIQHESGGNVYAKSPHSTAFGVGQLTIANRRHYGAKLGINPNTTDYNEQLAMFRGYIADSYGSDLNALEHERRFNWY